MKKSGVNICDFHTHVLPSADHGSSSIETSLFQLKSAEKCGVSRIVATPHFYPHKESVSAFIAKRDQSFKALEPYIPESVDLCLGAEVLFCGNIENIPDVEKLCINGSNIMLLELPFAAFDVNELSSLGVLVDRGIEIIIAHAERYSSDIIDECLDYGATLQINASSLVSLDRKVQEWLDMGVVSAMGSDIHGKNKRAYKIFTKAVKKISKYVDGIKASSDALWEKAYSENGKTVEILGEG